MKTNLKRFALILISAVLFAGCGKDNKAVSDIASPVTTNNSGVNLNVSGSSSGVRTFSEFRNEVNAGHFRNGAQTGFFYYQQISAASNSNSNCSSHLGGFIQFCSYSSSSNSSCHGGSCNTLPWRRVNTNGEITRSVSFLVDIDLGNTLTSRKDILVNLMDNADSAYKCINGQCLSEQEIINYCQAMNWHPAYVTSCVEQYEQQTSKVFAFNSNGFSYIVNLDRPLGANPTHIGELGGSTIYVIAN